jgi:uncharacterized protein YgbK (DUF1537 family)
VGQLSTGHFSSGQPSAGYGPGQWATLPPPKVIPSAREQVRAAAGPEHRLLVVDDDATGSQAVHDVSVLFSFDAGQLAQAFIGPGSCAFVLTNSRSLDPGHAARLNREIATEALEYCRSAGLRLSVISRSDSTLRGHLLAEVNALNDAHRAVAGRDYDAVLLAPAFFEAGRVTAGDVHWARVGGNFVPVGDTEFARDPTFGYAASDLGQFIAEKSGGRLRAADVVSITIEDIRAGGPERVSGLLSRLEGLEFVVVNALDYADYEVVALAALRLAAEGKSWLYRTAPSFVPVLAGVDEIGPLSGAQIWPDGRRPGHGLVVVGSHTKLTNDQVSYAQAHHPLVEVELDVGKVVDPASRAQYVQGVADRVAGSLEHSDVLLMTSRSLVRASGEEHGLAVSRLVSVALTDALAPLRGREPAWVIAKGGITSHDVAVQGFGIQRAIVAGQLSRGILSVFRPVVAAPGAVGMPYVVFAGNVGTEESLLQAIERLEAGA